MRNKYNKYVKILYIFYRCHNQEELYYQKNKNYYYL